MGRCRACEALETMISGLALKGSPVQICSEPLSVGDQAPNFSLRRVPSNRDVARHFMRCGDQLHQAGAVPGTSVI